MKQTVPHLVGVFLLASSVSAQSLEIDHVPIACAVAEKFARLEARFNPMASVAVARVVFQGDNASEWYSVAMTRAEAGFVGVLPKPKKSLKAFRYYIEATDKAVGTNRTPEHTTSVVDSSSACKGKVMAGTVASASVVVQGPAGSVVVPPGFASAGMVSGAAAGAAVAGGGGLSGGALVGIVAGVGGAAAAGVAVAGKGGGDSGPGTSGASPSSPPSSTSYTGPFNGTLAISYTWVGGACSNIHALSGTLEITLFPFGNVDAFRVSGTKTQTAGSTTCPSSGNFGIQDGGSVTGAPGNLTFKALRNESGFGPGVEFSGALNGSFITGTLTFTYLAGTTVVGSVSIPVTLR